MPMIFWIQSRCQITEINKTIDLGHRSLETGTSTTSKVEYVKVASYALLLTILFDKFIFIVCI